MVSPAADELVAEIEKIDNYFDIPLANMQTAVEDGMIQIIGKMCIRDRARATCTSTIFI